MVLQLGVVGEVLRTAHPKNVSCYVSFGRKALEDPGVDGRIILKWICRKWEGVVGTGWSWLRIGAGGVTCEYGDEPSGSIKCGEFLD